MVRELYSEINALYASSKDSPNVIQARMQMQDMIDETVLRHAVDTTMKRYPYFTVELKKQDDRFVFESNERPVTIVNSETGVELNSEASNFHLLAFSWFEDCIIVNISHALTDGTGTYELLRTLLYYYCSEYYDVKLNNNGIRLVGDQISMQEWDDPAVDLPDTSLDGGGEILPSLNPKMEMGKGNDTKTAFGLSINESEFVRFSSANDGSPGTMTSLFLSRANHRVYTEFFKSGLL